MVTSTWPASWLILALTILFRSIYFISARSFYAQQDTKTLYISIFTISLNIGVGYLVLDGLSMGVYGLSAASDCLGVFMCILFFIMSRRINGLFDTVFVNAVTRMASVAGFMAIAAYILVSMFPLNAADQSFFSSFPKFMLIVALAP